LKASSRPCVQPGHVCLSSSALRAMLSTPHPASCALAARAGATRVGRGRGARPCLWPSCGPAAGARGRRIRPRGGGAPGARSGRRIFCWSSSTPRGCRPRRLRTAVRSRRAAPQREGRGASLRLNRFWISWPRGRGVRASNACGGPRSRAGRRWPHMPRRAGRPARVCVGFFGEPLWCGRRDPPLLPAPAAGAPEPVRAEATDAAAARRRRRWRRRRQRRRRRAISPSWSTSSLWPCPTPLKSMVTLASALGLPRGVGGTAGAARGRRGNGGGGCASGARTGRLGPLGRSLQGGWAPPSPARGERAGEQAPCGAPTALVPPLQPRARACSRRARRPAAAAARRPTAARLPRRGCAAGRPRGGPLGCRGGRRARRGRLGSGSRSPCPPARRRWARPPGTTRPAALRAAPRPRGHRRSAAGGRVIGGIDGGCVLHNCCSPANNRDCAGRSAPASPSAHLSGRRVAAAPGA
jgi:hypothetical protein